MDSVARSCVDYSAWMVRTGTDLRRTANDSYMDGPGARCAFIAQLVVSIVMVPLNILAIIFLPAIALCFEGKAIALERLESFGKLELVYIALIPTCIVAACVPHSWKCLSPAEEVIDYFDLN